MTSRADQSTQFPAPYKALEKMAFEAERAAVEAGIETKLIELIRIRVSQINGCAFCLRMHTQDALKKGESTDRLAVLPAWRETTYFTDQDRAALAFAESVTLLAETGVEDEDYEAAASVLDEAQLSAVFWLVNAMNAYNRVGVVSQYEVGPEA